MRETDGTIQAGGNLICILGRSLGLLVGGWASGVSRRAGRTVFSARPEMVSGQRRDWGRRKVVGLEEYFRGRKKELGDGWMPAEELKRASLLLEAIWGHGPQVWILDKVVDHCV